MDDVKKHREWMLTGQLIANHQPTIDGTQSFATKH